MMESLISNNQSSPPSSTSISISTSLSSPNLNKIIIDNANNNDRNFIDKNCDRYYTKLLSLSDDNVIKSLSSSTSASAVSMITINNDNNRNCNGEYNHHHHQKYSQYQTIMANDDEYEKLSKLILTHFREKKPYPPNDTSYKLPNIYCEDDPNTWPSNWQSQAPLMILTPDKYLSSRPSMNEYQKNLIHRISMKYKPLITYYRQIIYMNNNTTNYNNINDNSYDNNNFNHNNCKFSNLNQLKLMDSDNMINDNDDHQTFFNKYKSMNRNDNFENRFMNSYENRHRQINQCKQISMPKMNYLDENNAMNYQNFNNNNHNNTMKHMKHDENNDLKFKFDDNNFMKSKNKQMIDDGHHHNYSSFDNGQRSSTAQTSTPKISPTTSSSSSIHHFGKWSAKWKDYLKRTN